MVYQCEQCQAGMLLASGGQGGPPQARYLEPRPEGGREQVLWGEQNLLWKINASAFTDPMVGLRGAALWWARAQPPQAWQCDCWMRACFIPSFQLCSSHGALRPEYTCCPFFQGSRLLVCQECRGVGMAVEMLWQGPGTGGTGFVTCT